MESFFSLWSDYNLLTEIGVSTFAVYLGLLLGIAIIEFSSKLITEILSEKNEIFELFKFFKYFPAFFFAILFSFWFRDSIIAELVFASLAVIAILFTSIQNAISKSNDNYINSALSYKVSKSDFNKIIWKDSQPKIYSNLTRVHYYLWALVMIFEYIGNVNGVGSVYYRAHNYNDYAAFFSLAILIAILIWIGDSLINILKNKLIHWE